MGLLLATPGLLKLPTGSFTDPSSLGADLWGWYDFTDPAYLYTDVGFTTNVANTGDRVKAIIPKAGTGSLNATTPRDGAEWDATNQQAESSQNVFNEMYQFVSNPTDIPSAFDVYFGGKTTDTRWCMIGVSGSTGIRVFLNNLDSPSINLGTSDTYFTNNVQETPPVTSGDLYTSWDDNVAKSMSARNMDSTNLNNTAAWMLNDGVNDGYVGFLTHYILTAHLSTGAADDLEGWLSTRLPV